MDAKRPAAEAIVAPREIQELVARLTQQSIEAVPAHEARTLEALALETGIPLARLRETLAEMRRDGRLKVPPAAWMGFVFLALFAYWVVSHPPPGQTVEAPTVTAPPAVVQPVVEPDYSDTTDLASVTYGPDGGAYHVDTTFLPSTNLPDGLSICATAGTMMWGSGDHRAKVIDKPLTPEQEKAVRDNVAELLRHVREDATRRRLPFEAAGKPGLLVTVTDYMYSGGGGATLTLPPPDPAHDKAAEAAIARVAQTILDQISSQLRQQEEFRRMNGP